jgi:hypothetical protein
VPRFCVIVRGGPVLLLRAEDEHQEPKHRCCTFSTHRFVDAPTSDEAVAAACRLVLEELESRDIRSAVTEADAPELRVMRVGRLSMLQAFLQRRRGSGTGFTWVLDSDSLDWEREGD